MSERKNHLRLITGDEISTRLLTVPPYKPLDRQIGEQLCFDFDAVGSLDRLIFVVAMENLHGRFLCDLITKTRPQVALDLRYAVLSGLQK